MEWPGCVTSLPTARPEGCLRGALAALRAAATNEWGLHTVPNKHSCHVIPSCLDQCCPLGCSSINTRLQSLQLLTSHFPFCVLWLFYFWFTFSVSFSIWRWHSSLRFNHGVKTRGKGEKGKEGRERWKGDEEGKEGRKPSRCFSKLGGGCCYPFWKGKMEVAVCLCCGLQPPKFRFRSLRHLLPLPTPIIPHRPAGRRPSLQPPGGVATHRPPARRGVRGAARPFPRPRAGAARPCPPWSGAWPNFGPPAAAQPSPCAPRSRRERPRLRSPLKARMAAGRWAPRDAGGGRAAAAGPTSEGTSRCCLHRPVSAGLRRRCGRGRCYWRCCCGPCCWRCSPSWSWGCPTSSSPSSTGCTPAHAAPPSGGRASWALTPCSTPAAPPSPGRWRPSSWSGSCITGPPPGGSGAGAGLRRRGCGCALRYAARAWLLPRRSRIKP